MNFREMIKKVQVNSGFSDTESEDALEMLVENLAVHLEKGERKDFASQLPQELKDIVLTVSDTEQDPQLDLLQQFMDVEQIPEDRAKKQLLAAWEALKSALSAGQIEHIRAQLPNSTVALLG